MSDTMSRRVMVKPPRRRSYRTGGAKGRLLGMQLLRGIVHPMIGPILPVILRQTNDAEETTAFEAHGYAIIDTGAALTGIDEDLAIRLKLPPFDTMQFTRPGPQPDFTAARFTGEIAFPGSRFPSWDHHLVGYRALDTRVDASVRVVALLGRDWMARTAITIHAGRDVEVRWLG